MNETEALNPIHGDKSYFNITQGSEIENKNDNEARVKQKSSNQTSISSIKIALFKTKVLLIRSFRDLYLRPKLWLGSIALHIFLAILFGIIAGNVNTIVEDTTGYIALSSLMLVFANIQFLFYMHKVNENFLKEHSRGLYSYISYWLAKSLPLYIIKVLNGLVFALILYGWIELNNTSDRFIFYLLIVSTLCIIGVEITDIVIYSSPTIRQAYLNFPIVIFILFYFSNFPVKPETYVYWMSPWVPSMSVFRWILQTTVLNEFEGDTETFPYVVQLGFDPWKYYKSIFGFGGKTRGYCYGIVLVNAIIYKVFSLIAIRFSSHRYRGKRHFYKLDKTAD